MLVCRAGEDYRRNELTAIRKYVFADNKELVLGDRTLIMGILNVTPDSFSDGGKYNSIDRALFHMEEMIAEGADIIDIGAESSRPGFVPIASEEEIARLIPFLEKIVAESSVPVSVDTFKAATASAALQSGANIINDIWGLQYAEEPLAMARLAAKYQAPVIAMHNQEGTDYSEDIILAMRRFFERTLAIADEVGLERENIIIDPGIGFGKTVSDNIEVLRRQAELLRYECEEYPLLLGVSRKSYIGVTLGLPLEERLEATGATCVLGIERGASILRVHDVKPIKRMADMTDVILKAGD